MRPHVRRHGDPLTRLARSESQLDRPRATQHLCLREFPSSWVTHGEDEPSVLMTAKVLRCGRPERSRVKRLWHGGPERAARGAWHDVVERPSSLGNPSGRVAARPAVSDIQRPCRRSPRAAAAGIPQPLAEDRPTAPGEGTQARVAIGDFKEFVTDSVSKSRGIATGAHRGRRNRVWRPWPACPHGPALRNSSSNETKPGSARIGSRSGSVATSSALLQPRFRARRRASRARSV